MGGSPCRNDDHSITKSITEYKRYSGWASMTGMVSPGKKEWRPHMVRNLQKNIPYHEIMMITGHKSLRNLETYIKVNKKKVLNSVISRVRDLEKVEEGEVKEMSPKLTAVLPLLLPKG